MSYPWNNDFFESTHDIYPKDDPIPDIVLAAQRNDLKTIKQHIKNGKDLNKRQRWTEVQEKFGYDKSWEWYGNSALIEASQRGFTDIVKVLLLNGANPILESCPTEDVHHTALKAASNSTQKNNLIIKMLSEVTKLWKEKNPKLSDIKIIIDTIFAKNKPNKSQKRLRKRGFFNMNNVSEPKAKKSRLNKNDKYEWKTGDVGRDKIISKLIEVLTPFDNKKEYCNHIKLASNIEKELYLNYRIKLKSNRYRQQYADLHFNFKKNSDLKMNALMGIFSVKHLVIMDSSQMANKNLKEKREKNKKKLMDEARNDLKLKSMTAMTDEYKCYKCKKRECRYSQAQTRSADEPMTIFVTCINCGNKWKC
eukprot:215044_1